MTPYQQELIRLANDEWLAYYQYWAGASQVKDPKIKAELLEHADEERKHSDWLTDILAEFGLSPEKQFSNILANTNCGYDMPVVITDGSILQSNLKAERCAIEAYTKVLLQTDNAKHHKVLHKILVEEVKHEQDLLKLSKASSGLYLIKSQMHLIDPNYKLHGTMDFNGIPISIENGRSRIREWHNPHDGSSGMTLMKHPYGYIRGIKGSDGDELDVYVGTDRQAPNVYIVNQTKAPNFTEYDEQKVMLGFPTEEAARSAYLKHYNDPRFLGSITTMPFEEFKSKVTSGKYDGKMVKALFREQEVRGKAQQAMMEAAIVAGADWGEIAPEEFYMGMKEEREHADITGGDLATAARIVLAHLKENPRYYTKMKAAGL